MKNSQKGFIVPVILIIVALIVIGSGVYVYENKKTEPPAVVDTGTQQTNTKTPPTPTPSATTIPTPSPTSTPIKKTDSQSLISITKAHLKAVRQTLPSAELFEVSSFIPFKTKLVPANVVDLLIVKSHFVTAVDDVSFVEVSEEFQNGESTHYSTSTNGFILGECYRGGAAPGPDVLEAYKNCGKETGKPEPRDTHLPIQNWKADLSDIVRVAKENNIQTGDITVATVGRVRNTPRDFTLQGSLLGQLSNDQTIILVIGREGVVENGKSIADGRYIILNAETGVVLEKGTFVRNPLPA